MDPQRPTRPKTCSVLILTRRRPEKVWSPRDEGLRSCRLLEDLLVKVRVLDVLSRLLKTLRGHRTHDRYVTT